MNKMFNYLEVDISLDVSFQDWKTDEGVLRCEGDGVMDRMIALAKFASHPDYGYDALMSALM